MTIDECQKFLLVPVRVKGRKEKEITGLIDTGTYPTYLDLSVAEEIEMVLKDGAFDINPRTGQRRITYFGHIRIGMMDKMNTFSVMVDRLIEEERKDFQVLIAPDIFKKWKTALTLDFSSDKIHYEHKT